MLIGLDPRPSDRCYEPGEKSAAQDRGHGRKQRGRDDGGEDRQPQQHDQVGNDDDANRRIPQLAVRPPEPGILERARRA